jgi:hypothetical protein
MRISRRSNPAPQSNPQVHSACWTTPERVLLDADADVLAIFDCCHALALCDTNFRSISRFEYLGACSSEERTKGPGEESFTTALIWALEKLKTCGPFTMEKLRQEITSYSKVDKFPRHQYPHFGNPWDPGLSCIMIHPIKKDQTVDGVPTGSICAQEPKKLISESLDVRLHFTKLVDDTALINTADAFRNLILIVISLSTLLRISKLANRMTKSERLPEYGSNILLTGKSQNRGRRIKCRREITIKHPLESAQGQ